jgi:hypothetical protein
MNDLQYLSRGIIFLAAAIGHNLAISAALGIRTLAQNHQEKTVSGLNFRNPLLAKFLMVVLLTLMLLLPLGRVESLIAERAALRDSAVARTWVNNGKQYCETKRHRLLAGSMDLTGSVDSASRKSGIYTVPGLLFFALSSCALGGLCPVVRCARDIFPARDHHDRHPQA